MTKRSHAREVAFQVIYQDDLNPRNNPAVADDFISNRIFAIEMAEFVRSFPEDERHSRPEFDILLSQDADIGTFDFDDAADLDTVHLAANRLLADPEFAAAFHARRIPVKGLIEFCRSLVAGARQNRPEIDAALNATADNWSLDRMAATDRNILRLAAYELLHTDTPRAVAIDEAIELAKRFGSAQSAQFVNGILDRLTPPAGAT